MREILERLTWHPDCWTSAFMGKLVSLSLLPGSPRSPRYPKNWLRPIKYGFVIQSKKLYRAGLENAIRNWGQIWGSTSFPLNWSSWSPRAHLTCLTYPGGAQELAQSPTMRMDHFNIAHSWETELKNPPFYGNMVCGKYYPQSPNPIALFAQ